jgi:hypothetical protein
LNRPEDESARHRLVWLEDGLLRHLNVDIRNIKTGADLGRYLARTSPSQPNVSTPSSASAPTGLQEYEKDEFPECSGGVRSTGVPADSDESEDDLAPDISLLTLNATGETRYLGPSSGSFFAKYASDFARSFATDGKDGFMNYRSTASYEPGDHALTAEPSPPPRISETLTPTVARYLIHCYYKWVHPLYPVIHASFRRGVVDPICAAPLTETIAIAKKDESEKSHLIMYYLMLALGAVHATAPHEDRIHNAGHVEYQELFSSKKLQPSILFMEALEWLDSLSIVLTLPLRIHIIQILLLICIYGGYRPSGNRHWQLAGIAIRVGAEMATAHIDANEDVTDLRRDRSPPPQRQLEVRQARTRPSTPSLLDSLRHRDDSGLQPRQATQHIRRAHRHPVPRRVARYPPWPSHNPAPTDSKPHSKPNVLRPRALQVRLRARQAPRPGHTTVRAGSVARRAVYPLPTINVCLSHRVGLLSMPPTSRIKSLASH